MWRLVFSIVGACCALCAANGNIRQALDLERAGQPAQARALMAQAAEAAPHDVDTQLAFAEFLDRYRDSGRRAAYEKALQTLGNDGSQEKRQQVLRRLVVLSLIEGDEEAARRWVTAYRQAGGPGLNLAEQVAEGTKPARETGYGWIEIPGPLYSFRRMAALSSDQAPEELLPALSRNVVTSGYRATRGAETLEQTEYMKLLLQYLSQARELQELAGPNQTIAVPTCESQETAQLLKILGFRLRNECGADAVLETVNPSRAFLSIDSGFPLAELEAAYRKEQSYSLPFRPTALPVLFGEEYWLGGAQNKAKGAFIDVLLNDPSLARLYVAMGKLHRPTVLKLKEKIEVQRLKNYAHVLDFFGGMFEIRDGKVVLPGGARTEKVWQDLVEESPNNAAEFLQKLIERDDGWMASFLDALARSDWPAVAYFTEPKRLERFYLAVRGRVTSPGPARPIFRANSEMLLLSSRMVFNADGSVHIPGGLESWKKLFTQHPHGQYDGKLTKAAAGWQSPDDVVEAMFALTRKVIENEPLQIFLAISNVDRQRSQRLSPAAVDRLIMGFPEYGDQFALFSEAPSLSEDTIAATLDLMARIDRMRNQVRRSDAIGMAQGLMGLWAIMHRQGQIPESNADAALRGIIDSFRDSDNSEEIFDAGRAGVRVLLAATNTPADLSPQDAMISRLAGNPASGEKVAHDEVVQRLQSLFNQQRLVSLKTIFDLADHLERVSRGESFNVAMANRLAAAISEVRLPRSSLSSAESNSFAQGHWVERHIQQQRSLNLHRAVDRAQGQPKQLLEIRGELTGLLRDSLVGLNYVYYAPPGAQLIRANPLFVRSHNFLGFDGRRGWRQGRVQGTGWPNSGGGRLIGALVNLPYTLAEAEQNFMVPTERQALIWQDLAPQILLGATVPRWWGVSRSQLHFVGLHMRLAEELLAQSAFDPELRAQVMTILERRVEPQRRWLVMEHFNEGATAEGIVELTPSELYFLAARFLRDHKEEALRRGESFASEIDRLMTEHADQVSYERIAAVFGTPHPELSGSYRPELLDLPLFPTMMGYSSRIMAESWESTNLYWAALADEMHLEPAQLNLFVPSWTQKSLERIFATHLEDWPALWRSMQIVGQAFRQKPAPVTGENVAAALE